METKETGKGEHVVIILEPEETFKGEGGHVAIIVEPEDILELEGEYELYFFS
tara:strand:- start:541 stop:696 length:156 start_codon:yes stop_codon:yes gene_type:complete